MGTAWAAETQWMTPDTETPGGCFPTESGMWRQRSSTTSPSSSTTSSQVMQYPWRRRTVRPGASRW